MGCRHFSPRHRWVPQTSEGWMVLSICKRCGTKRSRSRVGKITQYLRPGDPYWFTSNLMVPGCTPTSTKENKP